MPPFRHPTRNRFRGLVYLSYLVEGVRPILGKLFGEGVRPILGMLFGEGVRPIIGNPLGRFRETRLPVRHLSSKPIVAL